MSSNRLILASTASSRQSLRAKETSEPTLCWALAGDGNAISTINGISPAMAELFAPDVDSYLNEADVLVIPKELLAEIGKDGRPFPIIFECMRLAFVQNLDEVRLVLPSQANELLPYLLACNMLGMKPQAAQLEESILSHIFSKSLDIPSMEAVWNHVTTKYVLTLPNYYQLPIQSGFVNPAIIQNFFININLTIFTLRANRYSNPNYAKEVWELYKWTQNTKSPDELKAMMEKKELMTYVQYFEVKADRKLRKRRMNVWVEENRMTFGKGEAVAMPSIEGLDWYDDKKDMQQEGSGSELVGELSDKFRCFLDLEEKERAEAAEDDDEGTWEDED